MNHRKHKNSSKVTAEKQQPRVSLLKKDNLLIGIIGLIVVTAGGFLYFGNRKVNRQQQDNYKKLVGNWVRPDGGYIICIRNIDLDGQMQAAYFNPNPINVAGANVSFQNNAVKLFVELRDEGYPGSKYNLTYNSGQDILEGIYFQAQIQQFYDVVFQRIK
jgi:hypothetical protein